MWSLCISSPKSLSTRSMGRSLIQVFPSRSEEFHFGDSLMLFHATLYPEGVYWLPPICPNAPHLAPPHLVPTPIYPRYHLALSPQSAPTPPSVLFLPSGPHIFPPHLAEMRVPPCWDVHFNVHFDVCFNLILLWVQFHVVCSPPHKNNIFHLGWKHFQKVMKQPHFHQ